MCGRRELWSCCGGCIAPLLPACGEGEISPLTITEVNLALQFLGNKPSPSLKLVLGCWDFFSRFKCMSKKPSFMAIIAELITLWRLQTCVISIFQAVTWLAAWKMPAWEGLTWPLLSLLSSPNPSCPGPLPDLTGAALLPGHSSAFPDLPAAPPLSAAFGNREFPKYLPLGRLQSLARLLGHGPGRCCCYLCK